MPSAPAPTLLSPEHLAMMDGGVSVIVSSCGADLTPSVMRAVGSQIADGGRHITVFVCRSQSTQPAASFTSASTKASQSEVDARAPAFRARGRQKPGSSFSRTTLPRRSMVSAVSTMSLPSIAIPVG